MKPVAAAKHTGDDGMSLRPFSDQVPQTVPFPSPLSGAVADAAEAGQPQSQAEFILYTTLRIIGVLASIYMFLMGLDMMGSSFLVLGGKGAGDLFTIVDNPVTGLMVGIIATVLVQSSSTSTSIVAACLLGFYASYWRLVPLIYILVMFVAVPGVVLAISLLYGASIAGGIVVTLLALGVVAGFIAWWWMGGCYKVVSKEQREERAAEMAAEMGEKPAEAAAEVRCSWGRYPNGIPGSQSLVTCQNGLLSPADFRCSLRSCALPKVSGAGDKCGEGAFVPHGQRCTPTCMDGFETEMIASDIIVTLPVTLAIPNGLFCAFVDDADEDECNDDGQDAALRLAQVQVAEREVRSRRVNASERLRMALRACRGLLPDQPPSRVPSKYSVGERLLCLDSSVSREVAVERNAEARQPGVSEVTFSQLHRADVHKVRSVSLNSARAKKAPRSARVLPSDMTSQEFYEHCKKHRDLADAGPNHGDINSQALDHVFGEILSAYTPRHCNISEVVADSLSKKARVSCQQATQEGRQVCGGFEEWRARKAVKDVLETRHLPAVVVHREAALKWALRNVEAKLAFGLFRGEATTETFYLRPPIYEGLTSRFGPEWAEVARRTPSPKLLKNPSGTLTDPARSIPLECRNGTMSGQFSCKPMRSCSAPDPKHIENVGDPVCLHGTSVLHGARCGAGCAPGYEPTVDPICKVGAPKHSSHG
ncbi:Sodium-dependent phosphate transport protein 2A [Symbiodinium microadriaticum]|uniref:Sodium-dependent phosphate transport protein 2A n=1 Tax=Symbiodinium microadriaticum TaxID=2951 RepID=A0A1Q9DDG0_SYMMI|nr:Sodium-dependent phosphate transport protein 2A [Symbiodinium microadriaticum]